MLINQGINDGVTQVLSKINQSLISGKPLFVFIAGGSCSGKTTLTKELKKCLPQASILSMDDYFRNFNDPDLPHENDRVSFEKPDSYHLIELTNHLEELNQYHSVLAPIYDLKHNQRTEDKKTVFASNIIIVEGLFSINLGKELNLNQIKIFVDAPYRTRLLRRVDRDHNIASEEVVEHFFRCYIEPCYRKLIFPQSNFADLIIKNE